MINNEVRSSKFKVQKNLRVEEVPLTCRLYGLFYLTDDQLVVRIIPGRETGDRPIVTPHHGDQLLPREAQHACILVDNLFSC